MVLKCELFVEVEADDTSNQIVGDGRKPVGAVGQVIEKEHDPTTHKGVHHSN